VELTIAASGPQPAELAWERYARLELWPTWSPYLLRATPDGARLAPGLRGRVFGPAGVRVSYVVDSVDEPARQWSWTVSAGPVRVALRHGVLASPSGTVTWLVLRGPAPVILAYAPLAEWSLHRLVTRP
jgi:hypothetical protein